VDIQFQKNEDLSAKLTITLTPEDYQDSWENQLKKQQKSVSIKGFRPGKAPMGMVKKMYGSSVLANEINTLFNKSIDSYVKDNNIEYLARPVEIEQDAVMDFENPQNFVMSFELGLAPQFDLNIDAIPAITRYVIEVDDQEVDKEVEFIQDRFGEMKEKEVVEEGDMITATVTELTESGEVFAEGVKDKTISFTLLSIEDESTKKQFVGKKKGDTLQVNILDIYNKNEKITANTLDISTEVLADMNPVVQLEIVEVKSKVKAEVGQELFDSVFPGLDVNDVVTFREKLKENIASYFAEESEQLFEFYLDKALQDAHPMELPDGFLKKWLMLSNAKDFNTDNIEEKYAVEADALRKMLVRDKIAQKEEITVLEKELFETAISYSIGLFRQYGIPNASEDMVRDFALKQLKEEAFVQKMHDITIRRKVTNKLKELVTIQETPISKDDFYLKVNEQRGVEAAATA
jgi:trigger factor